MHWPASCTPALGSVNSQLYTIIYLHWQLSFPKHITMLQGLFNLFLLQVVDHFGLINNTNKSTVAATGGVKRKKNVQSKPDSWAGNGSVDPHVKSVNSPFKKRLNSKGFDVQSIYNIIYDVLYLYNFQDPKFAKKNLD